MFLLLPIMLILLIVAVLLALALVGLAWFFGTAFFGAAGGVFCAISAMVIAGCALWVGLSSRG